MADQLRQTKDELESQKRITGKLDELNKENGKLTLDLEICKNENISLKNEIDLLKKQCNCLELENKKNIEDKDKHLEQNAVEKNSWRREREALLMQVAGSNEKVEELTKCKEVMISEIEESKASLENIKIYLQNHK